MTLSPAFIKYIMKNILLLLEFFITSSGLSQDPQLFEDSWYLQKLTIDGIESVAPNIEDEASESIFYEDESLFATGYCFIYGCEIAFDNPTSSFDIITLVEFGDGCINQEDLAFDTLYYLYFLDPGVTYYNPFLYEITLDSGIRYLTFTNSNGDQARYSNQLLNVNEQEITAVSLFPNPVLNNLTIETTATIEKESIHSITGQLVKQDFHLLESSTINMENVVAGIYFVKLTTVDGTVSIHRIIKE